MQIKEGKIYKVRTDKNEGRHGLYFNGDIVINVKVSKKFDLWLSSSSSLLGLKICHSELVNLTPLEKIIHTNTIKKLKGRYENYKI